MGSFTGPLSEGMRRCMTSKQRKELGAPTQAEADAVCDARLEKELQRQIRNEILRSGVNAIFSQRMDKKTRGPKGQPDFMFVKNGWPVALEVKLPGGALRPDQWEMSLKMMADGWRFCEVHSVKEVASILRELGTA